MGNGIRNNAEGVIGIRMLRGELSPAPSNIGTSNGLHNTKQDKRSVKERLDIIENKLDRVLMLLEGK